MEKYRAIPVITAGTVAALIGPPANGQDADDGMVLTFGIESALRANDNFGLDNPSPGTTTLWDNTLSFGLVNTTPLDRLQLDASGIARLADVPGLSQDVRFDNPRLGLNYNREGANARVGVTLEYNEADLDFTDPLRLIDEDLNEDDLVISGGTRETRAASLGFETGLTDPLGFGLDLTYSDRTYRNTVDPDLFDRETITSEGFVRLRFSPVAEGRLTLFQSDYNAQDIEQTDRTTRSASFALTYALNPVTALETSLGYSEVEETTNLPTAIDQSGLIGSLGLTREMTNGSAGVTLDSSLSVTGRRDTLSFDRALDLPTGTFAFSIGATDSDVGDVGLIGSLAYIQDLPVGIITASLDRSFRTSDESNEIRVTRARLGYDMDINAVSGILLDVDYTEIRDAGLGTVDNVDTASLRAAYRYALTPDWDLETGYEHRARDSEADGFSNSNEVFLILSREFSIRR